MESNNISYYFPYFSLHPHCSYSYSNPNAPHILAPKETITPTLFEKIIIEPTLTPDVSGWIVKIGDLECNIEPLGKDYPDWYLVVCPEDMWLPIGQNTPIEVINDGSLCALESSDIFEQIIKQNFPDVLQLEFVQIEYGQWGCQVPFSDTAGIDVVCGFGCVGNEIGIILHGKTMRIFSGRISTSGSTSGRKNRIDSTREPPFEVNVQPGE